MKGVKIGFVFLSLMFVLLSSSCSKDKVVQDQTQFELPPIQAVKSVAAMVVPQWKDKPYFT